MAKILKSVKSNEKEILTIAGVAIGGGILLYSLARNAGGISDFIGKIFGAFSENIGSNIINALTPHGNVAGGDQPALAGTKDTNLGGDTGISKENVQTAIKQAGLPPATIGTEDLIALGAVAEQNKPGILDLATNILLGKVTNQNLAGNQDLRNAENALVSQLSQHGAGLLTGQTVVGLYKVPGGDVVPLTQNAVDYYNQVHVGITEIVHY